MSADRRQCTRAIGRSLAALLVAVSARAAADPPRDPAMAESLFKTGKELLQTDKWPEACEKFQASFDLDPAVGTLVKIARCREHEGKLAAAWSDYQRALDLNRQKADQTEQRRKELEALVRAELAALEPRVPKLRVALRDRPAGVKVTRNGQELPPGALGEALPVDPGEQKVVAEAPGYTSDERTVVAKEGELAEVTLVLEPAPAGPVVVPPPPPPPPPPIVAVPPPRLEQRDAAAPATGRGQRIGGAVVAGVGVVALGVAIGFGADTLKKVRASAPFCGDDDFCDPEGVTLRDNARRSQAIGLALMGTGVAMVGGGLALYFTAPKPASGDKASLSLRVEPAGFAVRGSF